MNEITDDLLINNRFETVEIIIYAVMIMGLTHACTRAKSTRVLLSDRFIMCTRTFNLILTKILMENIYWQDVTSKY